MRAASLFPREEVDRAEEEVDERPYDFLEPGMAEEPEEAIRERLQRAQDQINVIGLILHYNNYVPEEEKLRQIRVVVE